MSPARYRAVVAYATVLLALIIFTGAAVRLTDSGLGCEDWPTCNDSQVVPASDLHGWIEFGNRLLSGVVAIAVAAAVLSAYRRQPRRPDLINWAWGLVAGVIAQILLGAVTVKLDLHPIIVSFHFLLSAVLMWNALVLLRRAGFGPGRARPTVARSVIAHSRVQVGLAALVLVVGTIVTGTGPNSGDIRAERLGLDLLAVARLHSVIAWVFLASLVVLAQRAQTPALRLALAASVAQGGIGYWQYFTGVPPQLVELHVIGAVAVWSATIWAHLSLFHRPEIHRPEDGLGPDHEYQPAAVMGGQR